MTQVIKADRIYMFWHKEPFGKENFGDVLGPYIVEHLSGLKPLYIPLLHTTKERKEFILTYPRAIYNRKLSLKDMMHNIHYIKNKEANLLISIGSIIDWYSDPNCNIWGAGIMYRNSPVAKANFYAVRGKYTQLRLKELGYKVPKAIGDPALLSPLIYKPETDKKFTLGIIPHFLHYEETVKKLKSDSILVINLFDTIEKVIDDVCSCEKIISSSLHGIIISHAYGIPALWFNLAKDKLRGDDIKFADYFSSVKIKEYDRYSSRLSKYNEKFCSEMNVVFDDHKGLACVPEQIINDIQKNLIESAPFAILPQFKKLI